MRSGRKGGVSKTWWEFLTLYQGGGRDGFTHKEGGGMVYSMSCLTYIISHFLHLSSEEYDIYKKVAWTMYSG